MSLTPDWRPCASVGIMKARASLYQQVRAFFMARHVLEVETPTLMSCGVTEPHIANLTTQLIAQDKTAFLQTSPEYAMKRLLASGVGDCFQISKVYRDDAASNRHNPEFSLLEWYRLGFSDKELMQELAHLVAQVVEIKGIQYVTYCDAFKSQLNVCPLSCTEEDLAAALYRNGIDCDVVAGDFGGLLDLAMATVIEPSFEKETLTFLTEYPANQASLARKCEHDPRVSHRFEVFLGGLELANGYWELADAEEQRARFELDNVVRDKLGYSRVPIDENFIAALASGFPDCAGVALGLDRLLMLATGAKSIQEVLTFPFSQC